MTNRELLLPTIRLGAYEVTRLIIGGNPFSGGSHFSPELDRAFVDYYTAENIKRALVECERCGLNTMQSRGDRHIRRVIHEYRNEGGTLQWIAQTASELRDLPGHIRSLAGEAIAIYNHGSHTDRCWHEGRRDEVRELLKVTRDAGVLVGLGTHLPEVIEYSEEHGWDVDFYMACLYALTRQRRESPIVAGQHQSGEVFDDADREAMAATVRQTPKPCLAFKVLASNRKCGSPEEVRQALAWAFAHLKPTDAVVVGMFQRDLNQVAQNAQTVREVGPPSDP